MSEEEPIRRSAGRRFMTPRAIAGVVFAFNLVACARTGTPSRPATLIIATGQEPSSLNPLYLQGAIGYAISELGYSYLTNYDSRGNIMPDVAVAVPTLANGGISADGKRVTYHLRRDVSWQDGAPLNSGDVLFSYRAIMNPFNSVPSRACYDRAASVKAPDPYTVIVTLKRFYSPIVACFFGGDSNYPILPAHLLARYASLDRVAYNAAPIGSGPYRFVRWARGDRLEMRSNPRYYAGRPAIAAISLRFIHDPSTTINQLLTNEVDATFFADASRIAALRALPYHRVVVTPVPYFYTVLFNVTDSIAKDAAVRRAFALANDRHTLVSKVTHGLYDADSAMRGLFTWAFDPHAEGPPYDPQRAQLLLAKDGWIAGADGIRVKNGRRLHLQLAFRTGSGVAAGFAALIVEDERAVGIEVTTKSYSPEEFLANDGPLSQGRFQVALASYQSNYDPDASWLLSCDQRAPHGSNYARYCDPAVDRALLRGVYGLDRAARRRAYSFVQRQLLTDVPYDFLCQVSEVDVLPLRLEGYESPLLSPYDSVARWRL
jgi:peptide/nickel transport system substrate-binding protein